MDEEIYIACQLQLKEPKVIPIQHKAQPDFNMHPDENRFIAQSISK